MTDTVTRLMKHADHYALLNRISPADAATFAARQALEAELVRLFTPLNQCDGCMAGLPLRSGLHIDTDGKALMLCQKSKYQADEVAQLQEQNTALDARLAQQEAVMRMALEALKQTEEYLRIEVNEAYARDANINTIEDWRLKLTQHREAIKALEEQLK